MRFLTGGSLVVALACATAPVPSSPPQVLPDVFGPLHWSSRIEDLGVAFQGASVDVMRQDNPRRVLAILVGARTRALGDLQVVVEANAGGELRLIRYSSDDRRPECRLAGRDPGDIPGNVDCCWRGGRHASRTLASWEKILREQIGEPSTGNEGKDGEVERRWRRQGHEVVLSLAKGEDGLWEVALSAMRPRATD